MQSDYLWTSFSGRISLAEKLRSCLLTFSAMHTWLLGLGQHWEKQGK